MSYLATYLFKKNGKFLLAVYKCRFKMTVWRYLVVVLLDQVCLFLECYRQFKLNTGKAKKGNISILDLKISKGYGHSQRKLLYATELSRLSNSIYPCLIISFDKHFWPNITQNLTTKRKSEILLTTLIFQFW